MTEAHTGRIDSEPPPRAFPPRLVRLVECLCLGGILSSIAVVVAGLLVPGDVGVKLAIAGFGGLLLACMVPLWILATFDSIRAGQHASHEDLARPEFGATWGLLAYVANAARRRKRKAMNR